MLITNGFASAPFTALPSNTGNAQAGSLYTTKITLLNSAKVSAILIHGTGSTGALSWRGVIYDAAHSALMAQSTLQTTGYNGVNRLAIVPSITLAAGTYYVGYIADAGANVSIDSSQTNSSWWVNGGLNATNPPNPLTTGVAQSNGLLCGLEFDGSTAGPSGWAPDNPSSVTISGTGNSVATCSATAGGARSIAAYVPQTLNTKVYAEVAVSGTVVADALTAIGIVSASFPMSSPPNFNNRICQVTDAAGAPHGTITTAGTGVTFTSGSVIGIAYDIVNSYLWFNKNNTGWIGSGGTAGNPATGSNPINISTGGAPDGWYVCIAAFADAATVFTLRDTASLQAYSPPAGFVAWAPLPPTTAQLTQMGVEQWINVSPQGQLTQIGVEQWMSTPNPPGLMTQIAVEQWGSVGVISGKYYYEITATTIVGAGGAGMSVGAAVTTSTYTGMGTNATVGVAMFTSNGNIFSNGANTSLTLGACATGDVIGCAIDLDNHKAWFRKSPSGNWNGQVIGSQNPVGNVGGAVIPAGNITPICTFGGTGGTAGNVFTGNFGASAFVGAVPSGFAAGWAS